MIDAKEIRTIIGIIGTVISSLISLLQMPRFIEIYKKKSVEEYEPDRHVAMLMKCSLWVYYGLPVVKKDSILITITNGIGFVIEASYITVFLIYCSDKPTREKISMRLENGFLYLVYAYLITFGVIQPENFYARHIFIGVVCNIFAIVMYASLFKKTKEIKHSLEYMSGGFSFANFINAGIWTAYSLIYKIDIFVLISNGLGMLLCAFQLIINDFSQLTPTVNVTDVPLEGSESVEDGKRVSA